LFARGVAAVRSSIISLAASVLAALAAGISLYADEGFFIGVFILTACWFLGMGLLFGEIEGIAGGGRMRLKAKIYPEYLDAILDDSKDVEYRELKSRGCILMGKPSELEREVTRERITQGLKDIGQGLRELKLLKREARAAFKPTEGRVK
jgi:hypothetical protein